MKTPGQTLSELPLHPFLLPLGFTTLVFANNQQRLELGDFFPTLLALLAISAVSTAVLAIILGNVRKGALGTSILYLLLLYFPTLANAFLHASIPRHIALMVAIAAVLIVLIRIRRSPKDFAVLTSVLNIGVLVVAIQPIYKVFAYQAGPAQNRPQPAPLFPDNTTPLPSVQRDVWHLVFDRYGGAETLQQVYGFDNEPFLQALETRGFFVARNAAANYQRTAHSLASVYNMDYLSSLSDATGGKSGDWVPVYRLLSDNRVNRFFGSSGYRYIHLGSWWNPTRRQPQADENRNLRDMPELGRMILNISTVGRLAEFFNWGPAHGRGDQCARIKYKFEQLEALARDPNRTFVTAHILLPHPPYVIDASGNCMDLKTVESRSRETNYLGQLRYANQRILELVDLIINSSPTPPIIVIQSDEGPWPARLAGDERFLGQDAPATEWTELSAAELREKMLVLNAMYLPEMATQNLPDTLSPVNTYRLIFDHYFGTSLGLIPDQHFIYKSNSALYEFEEVTTQLR